GGRAGPSPGQPSLPAAGGGRIDLAGPSRGAERDRIAAIAARTAHGRAYLARAIARGGALDRPVRGHPKGARARAHAAASAGAGADWLRQRGEHLLAATAHASPAA